ncbi:MAG: hypothetical protein AAFQ81_07750 [Pseudomonadota bacterium]
MKLSARSTAVAAVLMLSTAPSAVLAATVPFDWTITYTDNGIASSVRVQLEIDDTPTALLNEGGAQFPVTSLSASFLTGESAGATGVPGPVAVDLVTFPTQTFISFELVDGAGGPRLALLFLAFQPLSDLRDLVPFSATTEFVSGTGYGRTVGSLNDVVATDTPAPVPLPASGALLALAAGTAALRAAAIRRRRERAAQG